MIFEGEKMKPVKELNGLVSQPADISGQSSTGLIKTDTSLTETSETPQFRCFHCDQMIASDSINSIGTTV